ncbi:EAL domain-containing protein [Treponema pectinovorum]|uniref:EAL domain-containing protein n=1 Tax=Treponema pectinovorum TaxID=164 RepID=UPI0011CBB8E5|nr:EAL domain-containing protein [Treponema pectinovorum]
MKKMNKEDAVQAKTIEKDYLTGLYTRGQFLEMLEQCRIFVLCNSQNSKDSPSCVLIYFNVSKFKLLNSTFGLAAGDECLKNIAKILKETFETDFISHFFSDHFVVFFECFDQNVLLQKIEQAHSKVLALHNNFKLKLSAGIFYYDGSLEASLSCDLAKIACDEIKKKEGKSFYNIYSEKLKSELELKKYIQDNIDKAVTFDYIQVYFQPIIRTLSGKLCSMEALARWQDPVKGYLSPTTFVPALEENSLTYKLDYYVIEKVAKLLRARLDKGLECVPVSVNLCRCDFDVSSPFEQIEKIFSHYNLPHEYLCVEITESAIMENPDAIRSEIEKLRRSGYEVWMDDFGSSYSSLNILKDFYFDLIKIDMEFLTDFNERSKNLISSIVDMAKKLGLHTLAEGVEKVEQVEFLKRIGCERIQGNFFDRPQSEHNFWYHLNQKNITTETEVFRSFYDKVGEINFLTENSLGLFEDYGKTVKEVFINETYRKNLADVGYTEDKITEKVMKNTSSFIVQKIRNTANLAAVTHSEENIDFVFNERFFKIKIKLVAECKECRMFQANIYSSELDITKEHVSELDLTFRNLILSYDSIYLLNCEDNSVQIIYSNGIQENDDSNQNEILKMSKYVYWKDRERFLLFHTFEYISYVLNRTGKESFSEEFRIKQKAGNFESITYTIISLPEKNGKKYLIGSKLSTLYKEAHKDKIEDEVAQSSYLYFENAISSKILQHTQKPLTEVFTHDTNLWNALLEQSNIKFFWKDLNRRFVGASRAFLDYYGFSHLREILGKTDEDLGWHLDDEPFRNDELRVLQNGEVLLEVPGQNVIQGIVHNISSTKFPVYEEGKICGLLGYFVDNDKILSGDENIADSPSVDSSTGFMTTRGFLISILELYDNYLLHNQNFAVGVMEIPSYTGFYKIYGREAAEELAKTIADKMRKYFDKGTIFARLQLDRFAICKKNENDVKKIKDKIAACASSIRDIHEVSGKKCLLHVSYGQVLGSEANSAIQLVEILIGRMNAMQKKSWNFSSQTINSQIKEFKMFFDTVRIISIPCRNVVSFKEDGTLVEVEQNCCTIWQREKKCTNCTSAKAMAIEGNASKIEILGKNIFFVNSQYARIDGNPYIIELIVKLEGLQFSGYDEKAKFFDKLSAFSDEIYIDSLTKVKNRKYYDEQVSALPFTAVAFLDMNKFKDINDTFGHREGDRVLHDVALAIKNSVRDSDIVCRYGGDEFVVCFNNISRETLKDRLEDIQQNVGKVTYGKDGKTYCSIGIGACYGTDKADNLVLKADEALYNSKSLDKIVIV